MDEVKRRGNVILFIDEMHTIIGAGAAEGAIDASNILQTGACPRQIQVIGATTINDTENMWRRMRHWSAFSQSPSGTTQEEAIEILKGYVTSMKPIIA